MGRNGLDNGWIQFHNKRIPREDMLMRWAQVSSTGEYKPALYKQLTYNSLISTRVELFNASSEVIKKALTIAIRYTAVRKQSPNINSPTLGEQQLLGYQTMQYRLFPLLATALALHFTAKVMLNETEVLMNDLEKNVDELPALHATSAGLKAYGTWVNSNISSVHC
jgi:acyl-CoA oxidase